MGIDIYGFGIIVILLITTSWIGAPEIVLPISWPFSQTSSSSSNLIMSDRSAFVELGPQEGVTEGVNDGATEGVPLES